MSNQIPDKNYVYNALLRYNYLPLVNKELDDIPFKIFFTEDFTPAIANQMLEEYGDRKRKVKGKNVNG